MHGAVTSAEAPRQPTDETVQLQRVPPPPPPPAAPPAPASGPPVAPLVPPGGVPGDVRAAATGDPGRAAASGPYRPLGPPPAAPGQGPGGTGSTAPVTPAEQPPAEQPPAGPSAPGAGPPGPRPGGVVGALRRAWPVALVAAVVGALVGAGAAFGVGALDDDEGRTIVARPPVTTPEGVMDVQAILDRVEPSVVTIETSVSTRGGVFEGAGTGIVLSEDGLIMTNAHVIEQSNGISVRTFDGAEHEATLVGSDPSSDLAVIRVEGVDGLTPATIGSSEALQVGEPVIAIGNAFNLGGQPSVTIGIVSALNRTIEGPNGTLTDLIQTDAAINQGNSGGPLVDSAGEVVGINTAIIEDSQNVGFAISIDSAMPIIEDLREGNGEVTPDTPRLGVSTVPVESVEEAVRDRLGIESDEGAFVVDVVPGSGADEAGIRVGDVIVAVDGEAITSNERLGEIIREHEPGDEVEITVEREGRERQITAVIGRQGG